ncbi:MAG: hypothetical protein KDK06_04790 [Gammaproteobacteria bacterium]|nr:hypothetical protein [Gammaproteobacteria bacterium]
MFDVAVLNQGALAVVVGLWAVLVTLLAVLRSAHWAGRRRTGLVNVAICLLAVAMTLGANALFNARARERAAAVVAAVERYRDATGEYPRALADLVPTYFAAVPRAKPVGMSAFIYSRNDTAATLMYVERPPYGRPVYDFASGEWTYLD